MRRQQEREQRRREQEEKRRVEEMERRRKEEEERRRAEEEKRRADREQVRVRTMERKNTEEYMIKKIFFLVCSTRFVFDWQEYIRRQLEEEQRHLEILQQQLLHEQAMLLVSVDCLNRDITFTFEFFFPPSNYREHFFSFPE